MEERLVVEGGGNVRKALVDFTLTPTKWRMDESSGNKEERRRHTYTYYAINYLSRPEPIIPLARARK